MMPHATRRGAAAAFAARALCLTYALISSCSAAGDDGSDVSKVFARIKRSDKLPVTFVKTALDPSFWLAVESDEPFTQTTNLLTHRTYAPTATAVFQRVAKDACLRAAAANEPRPLVVDVGASLGYFSMLAASFGCDVVAFEPQVELRHLFELSRTVNHFEHRIQFWPLAVSAVSGTRFALPTLYAKDTASLMDASRLNSTWQYPVIAISLDDAFREEGREILLLKIDVEHHDLEALEGARRLLQTGRVRNLLVELKYDRPRDKMRWLRAARNLGFSFFVLKEDYEAIWDPILIDDQTMMSKTIVFYPPFEDLWGTLDPPSAPFVIGNFASQPDDPDWVGAQRQAAEQGPGPVPPP